MSQQALFNRLAPRGSLQRFGIAGSVNSAAFFVLWELFLWAFSNTDVRILWGIAWGLTGIMAHFVHRVYTFDNRKPIKWTFATSVPTYFFSLVGSSFTIGILAQNYPENIRWLSLLNLLAWGFFIWFLMRMLVFQYKKDASEVQTA